MCDAPRGAGAGDLLALRDVCVRGVCVRVDPRQGDLPELRGGEYIGLSGIGEVRGWPKETRAQRRAYDPALRAALWARSEQLTGVRY